MPNPEVPSDVPQPSPFPLLNEDGSVNAENLANRFGLRIEDAMQHVKFGKYEGTVAEMLADGDRPGGCPVGGQIEKAYAEGGIDGVVTKFGDLKTFAKAFFDEPFDVQVSQETIDLHKKKPQERQIFPPTQNM